MLLCVVTFDEILKKLPTLVISYKVFKGTNVFLTRYYHNYENLDL